MISFSYGPISGPFKPEDIRKRFIVLRKPLRRRQLQVPYQRTDINAEFVPLDVVPVHRLVCTMLH